MTKILSRLSLSLYSLHVPVDASIALHPPLALLLLGPAMALLSPPSAVIDAIAAAAAVSVWNPRLYYTHSIVVV